MRVALLTVITIAGLGLTGCSSYEQVNQGVQGATSPAESGQHGAFADQAAPFGLPEQAKDEHVIKPIETQLTDGKTDPTMEGSGNIAAQGNYSAAELQRAGKKTDFLINPPKR